jgi:hypothetical protein
MGADLFKTIWRPLPGRRHPFQNPNPLCSNLLASRLGGEGAAEFEPVRSNIFSILEHPGEYN